MGTKQDLSVCRSGAGNLGIQLKMLTDKLTYDNG